MLASTAGFIRIGTVEQYRLKDIESSQVLLSDVSDENRALVALSDTSDEAHVAAST